MPCANPLFLRWVKEFHREKDYKSRGGPPRATGYENAIRAIESCTVKYEHPQELKVLSGVGPTCIKRLIEKLEAYCETKGIEMPEIKKKTKAPAKKKAAAVPKRKAVVDASSEEEAESSKKIAAPKRQVKRKRDEIEKDRDEVEEEEPKPSRRRTSKATAKEEETEPRRSLRRTYQAKSKTLEVSDSE